MPDVYSTRGQLDESSSLVIADLVWGRRLFQERRRRGVAAAAAAVVKGGEEEGAVRTYIGLVCTLNVPAARLSPHLTCGMSRVSAVGREKKVETLCGGGFPSKSSTLRINCKREGRLKQECFSTIKRVCSLFFPSALADPIILIR